MDLEMEATKSRIQMAVAQAEVDCLTQSIHRQLHALRTWEENNAASQPIAASGNTLHAMNGVANLLLLCRRSGSTSAREAHEDLERVVDHPL